MQYSRGDYGANHPSARPADFELVRGPFPAISTGCTACHRAFAREAPVIKP